MWSQKYDTNELIYKTEIDSQTWRANLWLPKGIRAGGIDWEFGIDMCTLLYIKQISVRNLLCSAGNCIWYLVITYNGKESEKEIYIKKKKIYIYIYIYIYISESFCCTPETSTVL